MRAEPVDLFHDNRQHLPPENGILLSAVFTPELSSAQYSLCSGDDIIFRRSGYELEAAGTLLLYRFTATHTAARNSSVSSTTFSLVFSPVSQISVFGLPPHRGFNFAYFFPAPADGRKVARRFLISSLKHELNAESSDIDTVLAYLGSERRI